MKLNLILSGGAARGAFHLGVLHFIEHHNIHIHAYSGSSIGSIIACAHASGINAKEQLAIFDSPQIKKAIKFNYFKNGLFKIDPNNKLFKQLLPVEKLEDLSKKVFINAYDMKMKKMHYFEKGDVHTLCMASCALIPLFKPINYNTMKLIDGGLIDNIPITPFKKSNEPTLSIDLLPRREKENKSHFNPFKSIKRRVFKRHIDNANISRKHSDFYLTSQQLLHFKMYTFNGLQECFKLGVKEAENFFRYHLNE